VGVGGADSTCSTRESSPASSSLLGKECSSCITIIDTIILTNYTNDAYIFYDMYLLSPRPHV
jgi:hypothetical protein